MGKVSIYPKKRKWTKSPCGEVVFCTGGGTTFLRGAGFYQALLGVGSAPCAAEEQNAKGPASPLRKGKLHRCTIFRYFIDTSCP